MIRFSFAIQHAPYVLLAILFVTSGCAEPIPSSVSVNQALVGSWTMVAEETLLAQIEALRSANLIRNEGDAQEYRRGFEQAYFTLELAEDASFTCAMGSSIESGIFSGYWDTTVDKISIIQTHEGAEKKKDRMDGRVVGDQLHMIHAAQGVKLPYIFERASSTE